MTRSNSANATLPWRVVLIEATEQHPPALLNALQSQAPSPWTVLGHVWDGSLTKQQQPDLVLVPGLTETARSPNPVVGSAIEAHSQIRAWCSTHSLALVVLYGSADEQVEAALAAMQSHRLRSEALGAAEPTPCDWHWSCDGCSDPECERRLFSGLLKKQSG